MKIASFSSGEYYYLFFGRMYIRARMGSNKKMKIDNGYPMQISEVWGWGSFGKDGIDAAYEVPGEDRAYFFCDDMYIRVNRKPGIGAGTVDAGYPKKISNFTGALQMSGFGNNGYDAILPNGNEIYFFVGSQYAKLKYGGNESHMMDASYPKQLSDWGLRPTGEADDVRELDTALFIKKDQFYLFYNQHYSKITGVPDNHTCPDTTFPVPIYEFDKDKYEIGRPTVDVHGQGANWLTRYSQRGITLDSGHIVQGISMPISEINLPGTHDSAAIQTGIFQRLDKRLFNCQNMSITDQLYSGIRVLDIRLAIQKHKNHFDYMTCHGNLELVWEANIYQSFDSVVEECMSFLMSYPEEFIVMSLKVDYWKGIPDKKDRERAIEMLYNEVLHSPLAPAYFYTKSEKRIPIFNEIQGKIFILDRINKNRKLGLELSIADNEPDGTSTDGLILYQDKYKYIGYSPSEYENDKFDLVINTIKRARLGSITINFASAVYGPSFSGEDITIFGVKINERFIKKYYDTSKPELDKRLGWILFDFATENYNLPQGKHRANIEKSCVDAIIESNF